MTRALRAASIISAIGIAWFAQACGSEPSSCPTGLGLDLEDFVTDGYNTVVKNSGGGSGLNLTWNCPVSGSATITGTANTQTVTFDLTFQFHACMKGTLTLDGALEDHTTNGGDTLTETAMAHSDALSIMGTTLLCNANPIDATCVVDLTDATSTICGLTSN